MMTKREMLLKNLRREGMYGLPGDIELTPSKLKEFEERYPGADLDEYFELYHRTEFIKMTKSYDEDGRQLFSHMDIPDRFDIDPFGVGMSYGSDAAFHMCHFHAPLEGMDTTIQQIQEYALPVITDVERARLHRRAKEIKDSGYAARARMEQTVWERAWLIRGMNDLMIDMSMGDERATAILDRITEHSCISATLYAEAGFDIICFGDDIGMQHSTMMSVPMWEEWLQPRMKKVIDAVKAVNEDILIFYHSCGFVTPFIPRLIDAGVDILNPIQPECMDLFAIDEEYGDRISFWGGIGTQTTIPFGAPQDVRERTEEIYEHFKDKGGMVICPTHIIEPEAPWKNLNAYRDTLIRLRG